MVLEFLVWLMPIIAFFTLSWLHVLNIIYHDSTPYVSIFWSLVIATVASALAAFLYFLIVTMFLFSYTQTHTFKLDDLGTNGTVSYVSESFDGPDKILTIRSEGNSLVLSEDMAVIAQKGNKAVADCGRFATRFPRLLNGGPFNDISYSSRCTITIPRGTIVSNYKTDRE